MEAAELKSQKENLVLVSAFFTNSLLLKGLTSYLSHYYCVHFIDLPGFIKTVPPLHEISVKSYARYVQKKLDALGLESFYLGGISFGFLVINNLTLDKRCRGIVAIAPYINGRLLKLSPIKKLSYFLLVNLTVSLNLSSSLWRSRLLHKAFYWYSDYPSERINHLLTHLDGKTFFITARIILNRRKNCRFQDRPHVLIINQVDRTIDSYPLYKLFVANVSDLRVVKISADHYPLDVSEDYFRERFPEDVIRKISSFFNDPAFRRGPLGASLKNDAASSSSSAPRKKYLISKKLRGLLQA